MFPLTLTQVLRALGRQWLLLALGLVVTSVLTHDVIRSTDVYWTQTTVRFVDSQDLSGIDGNALVSTSGGVIAFAGLVLADLDLPAPAEVSGVNPTILDVGIDDGVWVRLPDRGGQWSHSFSDAALDVQVSGSDPEEVRRRTAQVISDIRTATSIRQDREPNPPITIWPDPPVPVVAAAPRSGTAALAAAVGLGTSGALGVALGVDRLVARRRPRSVLEHEQID